ncbi:uncharacterized protein LOC135485342 [Lineus longissimus]|uniref:uncharacterized protein LOC135485342 n=1 Tax=Lineus longissimus TaxID=88925 RepID=UPI002B4CE82D
MQRGEQRPSLKTGSFAIKIHPDHKMFASQKRYGRHLATKSVTERDFASRRRDIDDSEKVTLQKLKLEKIKVWEELRRINVKSRSLKRGSLIEREIVAERKKLEKQLQEQHRPVSSAAIHNHLSGSLMIRGVQPQPRPTFKDEEGRPMRPKTTSAYRVALSARQIVELRPKTAGAFVPSGQALLHRESSELLPAAMNRKLLKADRLADSLDNLHIRHYLSPEELKFVESNNRHNRTTRPSHSGWQPRRLLSSDQTRTSSDDGLVQATDEISSVLDHDSVQPKRLLQRERSANKLREKSLSVDDISHLQGSSETREAREVVRRIERDCDILATKGFITKPMSHPTVVKLPSVEPEDDNAEGTDSS